MTLLKSFQQWFFPPVCLGCETGFDANRFICDRCLTDELAPLPPRQEASVSQVLLPQGVVFQDAMWIFSKKQLVQDLLHFIKYGGLPKLAVELGTHLGKRLKNAPEIKGKVILVPVPLHPKRKKKRGYNQAEEIAKGIQLVTGWPVLESEKLIRTKNTKTQTGFAFEKRQENIASAFQLKTNGESFDFAIIVDDVYTTGATVFELHRSIYPALAPKTAVATLAVA